MWLGIDFGTYYSSAALLLDGELRRVKEPVKHGHSLPSAVYLPENGEPLVGYAAINRRSKYPERFQDEFKRDLGSQEPYALGMSPEELVVLVIRYLKREADKMLQGRSKPSLSSVIMTIPATYTSEKRKLMRKITEDAGFNQIELLEEPIAAAIYYAEKNQQTQEEITLVYDLGAGTFDASLIKKKGKDYQIIGIPGGLSQCGGSDFDRKIYQDFLTKCSEALRKRLDRRNQTADSYRMRVFVEDQCCQLKHQLSEFQEAEITIPGSSIEEYSLTRHEFNSMIAPFIEETIDCCDQLLRSAGMRWEQVNQVLLVGGSCRIPYVQEVITKAFGYPPLQVDDPELAISIGAAIYGDKLKVQSNQKQAEDNAEIKYKKKIPFYDKDASVWR